jgi:hypothetical protein
MKPEPPGLGLDGPFPVSGISGTMKDASFLRKKMKRLRSSTATAAGTACKLL